MRTSYFASGVGVLFSFSVLASSVAALDDPGVNYLVSVTTDKKVYSIFSGTGRDGVSSAGIVATVTLKNLSDRVITLDEFPGDPRSIIGVTTRPDGTRILDTGTADLLDIGQLPPGGASVIAYNSALPLIEFKLRKALFESPNSGFGSAFETPIVAYIYTPGGVLQVGPRQERELGLFVVPFAYLREFFGGAIPGDLRQGAFQLTATVHGITYEPYNPTTMIPQTATASTWVVLKP